MRTCGDCTLCCKTLALKDEILFPEREDHIKLIHTWCNYCEPGRGCHIYPVRPQTCVDYQCLWLSDPSLPEELRPDRVRAVMDVSQDGVICVHLDQHREEVTRKGPLAEFLRQEQRKKTKIMVTNGVELWAYPNGRPLIQISEKPGPTKIT